MRFSVDSRVATGPTAQFDDMPEQPILTLGMDPPESWLVESIWSPYDLDNIHLSDVPKGVHSEFELEHLLLEGMLRSIYYISFGLSSSLVFFLQSHIYLNCCVYGNLIQ